VSEIFSDVRRIFLLEVKNEPFFFACDMRRRLLRKDGENHDDGGRTAETGESGYPGTEARRT
jgi:hypothetical protein